MKTIRCILTDMKQVLTSPYFFAGIAIMAAVCFTENAYLDASTGKTYNIIEAFFLLRGKGFSELTAERLACKGVNGYGLMFMGVIASFPFIFISCGEQKSGLRFSIYREGPLRYSLGKSLSALISAGLVCGLGYLLFTAAVFLMFPSGEFVPYPPYTGFLPLYSRYLFGAALSGMSVSLFPLFISAFTSNRYFCVCIPFLADYLRITIGNALIMDMYRTSYDPALYNRIALVYPDYMSRLIWEEPGTFLTAVGVFACSAGAAFAAVYSARKGRTDIGA